jgi:ribosomal protein S18 acetylase RimI-like enzyme
MEIALLSNNDVDAFLALRIEAVNLAPSSFAESIEEVQNKSRDDFAQMLESHGRGDFVLGAIAGERKLVGMVGFYRDAHSKLTHKGYIWGMYVTPTHRRQGLGRLLLSRAIERIKTHSDIAQVNLNVVASNETAVRLYTSLGFMIYGNEPRAINVNGRYFDESLMQRVIEQ